MTTTLLLLWILGALLLQVALGVFIAFWRRPTAAAGQEAATAVGPSPPTGAWQGLRQFRVVSRVVEDSAGTQCSFYLAPVDTMALPDFKPGQFLTFTLPVEGAVPGDVPRVVTRCYSLSDQPDPGHYRITVKRVPAPAGRPELPEGVASNHLHDRVHVGDVLDVRAPAGHFFIDPDAAVPVVLVAGGIGITPMMSMLLWCQRAQPQRPVHLFYGLRNGGEHAFKQELEALASTHPHYRLHVAYSRPAETDRQGVDFQHAGHVDVALLRKVLPLGRHQFYICGPTAMMETLVPALGDWGVPQDDIHFEAFGPASVRKSSTPEPAPQDLVSADVQFARSGRTLAWDGQDANLLDFAERHGIAMESGCRSGGCGSCATRLVSGSVGYAQQPDHDIAPGYCLPCVGTPLSPLVLEA